MKTLYKLIATFVFLLFAFTLHAQTEKEIKTIRKKTNVTTLQKLSLKYKTNYEKNMKKALKHAKLKGWEIRKKSKDGSYMELHGITDDLKPIYYMTLNKGAGITARTNTLYSGGSLGLNVHGESMTAGVWDSGALRLTHEAFENRATQMDGATSTDSHANHVAGTIIASDQFQSTNARGMAFKGNVHGYTISNDKAEAAAAAANGLLLSNHSYAFAYGSVYNSNARDWDNIMCNAPYYLAVFAAGNGGGPVDRITYLSSSKNSISVASVFELLNYSSPSDVVAMGGSSRGPTDDARIKPDISAKGVSTFSIMDDSDSDYGMVTGTSTAAPSVTGTLLLLQQHYTNLYGGFMLAATLRGLAIHTADEAGSNPGPDITFGWGLINAKKAAQAISNVGTNSIIEENILNNSDSYSFDVTAMGFQPLVVSICWTDVPGSPAISNNDPTPRLVNDLDVSVDDGGTITYPWKLDINNVTGAALQGDNDRDNVEKIEITNPVPGQTYTITVTHKGSLQNGSQNYSLIVTGIGNYEGCHPDPIITTDVNSGDIDYMEAENTITALNTINLGGEAVYHASDEVLMQDDFEALNGSIFRAYIEGCTTNFANRNSTSPIRKVITYPIHKNLENNNLNDGKILLGEGEFQIIPNPTKGIFNIKLKDQTLANYDAQIFSVTGRLIYSNQFKNTDENSIQIDISTLPNGMYFIKLISLDGTDIFTQKIIKE